MENSADQAPDSRRIRVSFLAEPVPVLVRRIGPAMAPFLLLVVALALRVYGLNWDRGLYFHPDERQILMVVDRLSLPREWRVLLSTSSPLNPQFFAYGSLPIYLLRLFSWLVGLWRAEWASMARYYLLGRLLSALFDTGTVYATYALARKVFGSRRVATLAAALVAFTVLHIQLAHFYTVDTLLTLLVVLAVSKAVDVARRGRTRDGVWLGALLGAALATKVSVLPLGVVTLVAWTAYAWPARSSPVRFVGKLKAAWHSAWRPFLCTLGAAVLCFILLEPYAVLDAFRFGQGVGQEVAMSQGWADFPYTRQYAGTLPYVYQASQILRFSMGLPLGLLGFVGLLWLTGQVRRQPSAGRATLLSWPLVYGLVQGAAYAKFVRYMLPLLPFLCVAGAVLVVSIWDAAWASGPAARTRRVARWGVALLPAVVLLPTIGYVLAFLNIYAEPHPWIQASAYLCEHLPERATLLTEYWDDPLPVRSAAGAANCPDEYTLFTVDFHAPDTKSKLEQLLDGLVGSDYVVLSSDRLYAPITRLAERYPLSSRYYRSLFAERLGFKLVAAPAVYPRLAGITLLDNPLAGLPLLSPPLLAASRPQGLVLDLGRADESFTVYDHPQPLIFQKVERLSRQELQAVLQVENLP